MQPQLKIEEGSTYQLMIVVSPSDYKKQLSLVSSNPSVASVNQEGLVCAVSKGSCLITATVEKQSVSCQVTVTEQSIPVAKITISEDELELDIRETIQLYAEVIPDNATSTTVKWISSKPKVAAVDDKGQVMALSIGETEIIAQIGNVVGSCTIKVTADYIYFEDPLVKRICMDNNWDTNGDGEVSKREASHAYTGSNWCEVFRNTDIKSFDECRYFTSVDAFDFRGCSKLERITLPSTILISGSFSDCAELQSVVFSNYTSGSNPIRDEWGFSIDPTAFSGCSKLSSISLPSDTRSIGSQAFERCISLTSISLPNGIKEIAAGCFSGCTALRQVTIPNSVNSFLEGCFSRCNALTDIIIPESVSTIGEDCFNGCSSLTRIIIPESVSTIGENCFQECISLTEISLPNNLVSLPGYLFYKCTSLANISLPKHLVSLGEGVFWGCSSLSSIIIPDSVQELGGWLFSDCSNLSEVYLPSHLTELPYRCFNDCVNLHSISLPAELKSIGYYAFNGSGLTEITIPEKVQKIYTGCFFDANNLYHVTFLPEVPPVCVSLPGDTDTRNGLIFYHKVDIFTRWEIYVPAKSIDLYKAQDYLVRYSDKIKPYN